MFVEGMAREQDLEQKDWGSGGGRSHGGWWSGKPYWEGPRKAQVLWIYLGPCLGGQRSGRCSVSTGKNKSNVLRGQVTSKMMGPLALFEQQGTHGRISPPSR